ncbi:MAG: hypothetical protein LAN83_06670 [Acidobacteriia bacterium]|nr:hypothetical protein [Terriglobia bacterium]
MISRSRGVLRSGGRILAVLVCLAPLFCAADDLDGLLTRTSKQVSGFLDQFSDVKCTEHVTQEKLGKDAKVELKEESTYDYLVILTNPGGELSLDESRLPVHEAKPDKKNTSLLVTNGFATLFLVFHPYYAQSFQFTALEDEVVDGRRLSKVAFRHIPGTRSPAALALRGKEYPLELSGTALIDPQTGVITRIEAGVDNTMEDVGLKTLRSEVEFAPVPFRDEREAYWFPTLATVEVETQRQHWRNLHRFTDYKRFSVSTEEQVANK